MLLRLKAVERYGIEISRQTKKLILSAVSNLFIVARDKYEIVKENPCNRVIIPKEKNDILISKTMKFYLINESSRKEIIL